jgi:hypothetical protein
MTRIIGKAPIELRHPPKVSIRWPDQIRITTGGFQGAAGKMREFGAFGDLSPGCAAILVVELRKALRQIRIERAKYYDSQVIEAEKPLP